MKTHQHRILFRDIPHRQASAVPIAPRRPIYRRQYQFGLNLADMLEIIFHDTLFRRNLGASIQVLHAAPPARPKILALRNYAAESRLEYLGNLRQLKVLFLSVRAIGNQFARQGAFDEDGFAVHVGNAAAFLIKGFNDNGSNHSYAGDINRPVAKCEETKKSTPSGL